MDECSKLSDEELLLQKDNNDKVIDILMMRYKPLVLSISKSYFLKGAEQGDIIQEGMIGLFQAIRDYSSHKNTLFKSFATLCIKRKIIDAVKGASRNKHIPLNESLSLDTPTMAEVLGNSYDNPENVLLHNEEKQELRNNIYNSLSCYEIQILNLYLNSNSYSEIADKIGKDYKSIDNAIQRIKRKIRALIS